MNKAKQEAGVMAATRDSYILMNFEEQAITLYFSYKIHEEDGKFFAECPQLQCMDQGDTRIDAINNLKLMIRDIIDYAVEGKSLDEMLTDLKFKGLKYAPR
jgi:predicted RNase H-like HicB family nuclease